MGGRSSSSGFSAGAGGTTGAIAQAAANTAPVAAASTTPAAETAAEARTRQAKTAQAIMRAYNAATDVDDRVALSALRDAQTETTLSFGGLTKTLRQAETENGARNSPSFNADENRTRIMRFLNRIAPGQYEFRSVRTGSMPIWGMGAFAVNEWRLFRK